MSQRYRQSSVVNSSTRFSAAPGSGIEFSRMTAVPSLVTTMNAGDIVPIYNREILPHTSTSMSIDFVIRSNTVKTPTFGNMMVDIYAFFVPNRIVNESWKNLMGENTSGEWVAPEISLVPLYTTRSGAAAVQIPVQSVADYYGYPAQKTIPAVILQGCHDFLFRGYLEIYNTRFRDQNYQPPIPYSKLNIYEGFLERAGLQVSISADGKFGTPTVIPANTESDGSSPAGAVIKALYGDGSKQISQNPQNISSRVTNWSALDKPLKANKLHDYFTSGLPSAQKGVAVSFNLAGHVGGSLNAGANVSHWNSDRSLLFESSAPLDGNGIHALYLNTDPDSPKNGKVQANMDAAGISGTTANITGSNLYPVLNLSNVSAISLPELRDGVAIQQVYEIMARSGSRYREYISAFFGLEIDNPFCDIPKYLGHIRRNLDLYQTAQTSPSIQDGTPQGNLAAFGYTSSGGALFQSSFVEHGYLHVFAVIRHKNLYSSLMTPDKFRLNGLDFYTPPLANISEQPVYTKYINPFVEDSDSVFAFQEAWAEYRYEFDQVSGYMRSGIASGSLALWNYSDEFDSGLTILDGDWLKSNSAEVLDRTLAVTSARGPQYKAAFWFTIDKELPMPTYSVPGLDII